MRSIAIIVFCLVGFVCCAGLQPELIEDSAKNIVERHDAYVDADPTLDAEKKAAFKSETELFLKVIEEAKSD